MKSMRHRNLISFKRCYILNIEQIQGEDDVNHRLEKIRESVKKLSTSERYNLAMVSNRSYLPSTVVFYNELGILA